MLRFWAYFHAQRQVEKYTLPTRAELPKVWSPKRKQLEESNAAEEEQTSKRVKLTLKGRAAVDPEV